ncbi:MAG: RpoL/Rpb11 RNA polymerase subunit family protein [Thermoproteota archaeon]|jgi:DNA-directed RNA polymerase subunit L
MTEDMEVIERSENELELVFKEPSTTFLDPLVSYILKYNEDVLATYSVDHVLVGPARLIIRSKTKPAKEVLISAMEKIMDDLEKMRNEIKSQVK